MFKQDPKPDSFKVSKIGAKLLLYNIECKYAKNKTKSINTNLNGGRMKIKFTKAEETRTNPNAQGKTFPIVRVHGTALEGNTSGQAWSTQFFANNKSLKAQVDKLNAGDTVTVKMEKNGKFWNPGSFTKDETPIVASTSGTVSSGPIVSKEDQQKLDRRSNIKMAVDILGPKPTKKDDFEYVQQAGTIADLIQDYVDNKGAFQFGNDTSDDIPDEEVDVPDIQEVS
jgi:hypothetical protein